MSEVILRDFNDNDLTVFKKWLYLPHVAKWYDDPESWINEVEKRNVDFKWLYHFIAEVDNQIIGFCQYYEYKHSGEDWHGDIEINGTYSIDYMIGEVDFVGKGYGRKIINALVRKICTISDAKRIIVQPEKENKASCNALLSCDFIYDEKNKIYILNL